MIWLDKRAAAIAREVMGGDPKLFGYGLLKLLSSIRLTNGAPSLNGMDPSSKMLWLKRHEPRVYERSWKLLDVKDWLILRATGRAVTFTVKLVGTVVPAGVYTVSVVKDGGTFGSYRATGLAPSVSFTDTPDAKARSYYRVQVEGPAPAYTQVPGAAALSGNMLGLTNPIHFNFDPAF